MSSLTKYVVRWVAYSTAVREMGCLKRGGGLVKRRKALLERWAALAERNIA